VIAAELRETVIGAGALAVLAAALALFYSGEHLAARAGVETYRISADFNRIDGLEPGAEVRLSGVPVGRVETVSLSPNFRVHTAMLIDADVKLPADTAASIQTDGLFGGKFMVLDPGGDERTLKDGGAIAFTQDAVVVSDLLDLIIAEGRAARARPAKEAEPDATPGEAPAGLLGGSR
jgi:phospholipid/cholesterol/gamma-HCH transport system substrate-binding protein